MNICSVIFDFTWRRHTSINFSERCTVTAFSCYYTFQNVFFFWLWHISMQDWIMINEWFLLASVINNSSESKPIWRWQIMRMILHICTAQLHSLDLLVIFLKTEITQYNDNCHQLILQSTQTYFNFNFLFFHMALWRYKGCLYGLLWCQVESQTIIHWKHG